jgi:hypothetical protein
MQTKWWLALGVLACGPRATPAPAVAPVAAVVDLEALCPTTPPTGYVVQRAEAGGTDGGVALAAARAAATEGLVERACSGLSESRCDAARRAIAPWQDGHFDAVTGTACASVAMKRETLQGFEADRVALDDGMRHVAGQVASMAGSEPVLLLPPTWASGCSAGRVGSVLGAKLSNEVARHEVLLASAHKSGVMRVGVELAPDASALVLSAWMGQAGDNHRPIEGFSVARDVLGVSEGEEGACRADAALGLEQGSRVGAGGLVVTVDVPTSHGTVCEGTSVAPVLSTDRPARVRIYSVDRSGKSLLVWPEPGVADRVDGSVTLGAMTAIPTPDGTDERLVAVAIDAGAKFGATENWVSFCEVGGGLGPDHYPAGAAVGSASFSVLPAGSSGCETRAAEARSTLFELPLCGS